MARWLLAAIHLLGLGIGLGAVWARASALRGPLDRAGLQRVFRADAWWGIAALIWIVSGLIRAFGGFEKGTGYYLANHLFLTKMALLAAILVLELGPMVALVRWRTRSGKGLDVDTSKAGRFATTSVIQAIIVIVMVLLATGMARGYGSVGS